MSEIVINSSTLGGNLQDLLMADDLEPGSTPSYQLCKTIYSYHPLGAKMAESPIAMAQSQRREISIPAGPEERCKEAFQREWDKIEAERHIFNVGRTSRIYGIASIVLLADGVSNEAPIDYWNLPNLKIAFNVLDPLNTAGSLVLDQNPNSINFQKVTAIRVDGRLYHRSRAVVLLNEDPLYIEYTQSAFGYVGRSIYQRALFPLKSFIQSMITDDMVTRKAGVLVAMMKSVGSIVDRVMMAMAGIKRQLLKEAKTDNVISIDVEEKIESLNLQNIDGASKQARTNILENIAVSADMPAKLLNSETFAEGFGEGTEDAKHVARYIDRVRIQLDPLYKFFDKIVMFRAWTPEFYRTIQAEFPEYEKIDFKTAFITWSNSFVAAWPSLITEPDSEKIKVDDVKLRAMISVVEVLNPQLDGSNRAAVMEWLADNFNALKLLFPNPLVLDFEAIRQYVPEQRLEEPTEPRPFADSQSKALDNYNSSVRRLTAV